MKRQKTRLWCDIAFGLALLLKIFSSGNSYFPILDDYVQYGSYPLFNLDYVYLHIGTICARPLASLLDPVLWGAFWKHMEVALLLISLIYFFSCCLLDRLLAKEGVHITPFLYTICLLLPLTFEGTYWISASSRIVMGFFFAVLASYTLQKSLRRSGYQLLPLYALLCLLSFGFYESVMIFSGLLQLFVLVKYVWENRVFKKLWVLLIPAFAAGALLIYYKLASNLGVLASRATGFSLANLGNRFMQLFSQLGTIFSAGLFRTTITGFIDGIHLMLSQPAWGIRVAFMILIVSATCAIVCRKYVPYAKASVCVPLGLCLFLLPLLPNVLVPDVWLTYRSIAICIPGLCIALAPLLAKLFKKSVWRTAAIFMAVLLFSVGCVNEVQTYKNVNKLDNMLLDNVIPHLDSEVLSGKKNTILVLPHEIVAAQSSYYKDHVKSVFYSDWSLTGAVRAKTKNNAIKNITPVYTLDGLDKEGKLVLYMDTSYHVTEGQNES